MFNRLDKKWRTVEINGDPPKGFFGGAYCSSSRDFYLYGGEDGSNKHGELHRLPFSSLTWNRLAQESPKDRHGPMKKFGCGMVYVHGNKLALFGGYGDRLDDLQEGSVYQRGRSGWTNEFHLFDCMITITCAGAMYLHFYSLNSTFRFLVLSSFQWEKTFTT